MQLNNLQIMIYTSIFFMYIFVCIIFILLQNIAYDARCVRCFTQARISR